jgi:hypothetical protein
MSTLQTKGLPSNMCILEGFPITLARALPAPPAQAPSNTTSYPFGLWFANKDTLYVADEGDGYNGTAASADMDSHAAAQTTAGLQKWVFNHQQKTWQLAYVIQNGLNLGKPYTVANYPTGINAATGLPWAPATDGLRNITGLVGPGNVAAIWGVTSTVSGNGDQGADPNKVVVVLDRVDNTDATKGALTSFFEFQDAQFGEVLRGVAFTPGSDLHGLHLLF